MTATGAATTTWRVDAARSTAGFSVGNFGVRQVRGTVPVLSGTVTRTDDGRVAVLARLDAAGVDTGNARRDRDLRAPGLLGTEHTPVWTFVGDDVRPDDEGWQIRGVLTVRRDCPLVLSVGPAQTLPDGGLRVRVTTSLDRRDAGVRAPRVLVGRRVEVELDVVLDAER